MMCTNVPVRTPVILKEATNLSANVSSACELSRKRFFVAETMESDLISCGGLITLPFSSSKLFEIVNHSAQIVEMMTASRMVARKMLLQSRE